MEKTFFDRVAIIPGFFIALLLLISPMVSEASKGVSVTVDNLPQLAHDWVGTGSVYNTDTVPLDTTAWGAKWLWGLDAGASASILYRASLINNDTGLEISDGSNLPVGTTIRIERVPAQDSDISWNGTGKAFDTPYGFWVADAGPQSRACHAEDQTYSELVVLNGVEAPMIAYTLLDVASVNEQPVGPSANLSCSGNICEVIAPGPISIGMDFSATYGRFYYRYLDHPEHYGGGCRAKNAQMRVITGCAIPAWCDPSIEPWCNDYCLSHGFQVEPQPYDLQFPQANVTFSLNATPAGNSDPLPPTVIPQPFTGETNTAYPWTVAATDPDNDDLYYQFDWNDDGLADQNSGSAVNSGVSQVLSNPAGLWSSAGTYTFKVRTIDVNFAVSSWTSAQITVTEPVVPVECSAGETLSWTVGSDSCSGVTSLMSAGGSLVLSDSTGPATGIAAFSCRADGTWDSVPTAASCSAPPVPPADPIDVKIDLDPKLIRYGDTADVTINITSPEDAICTVYGVRDSSFSISHLGADGITTHLETTKQLTSTQTISVYCQPGGPGASPSQTEEMIKVLPTIQEL